MRKSYFRALTTDETPIKLNKELEEDTPMFGWFVFVLAVLYLVAGVSVLLGRKHGSKLAFIVILTYTWFFMNPYFCQAYADQQSIWTLLIK